MVKKVSLLFCSLLMILMLQGQCPNRDSLWQRIGELRNDEVMPPQTIRSRLFELEQKMIPCDVWQDSTRVFLYRAIASTYMAQGNYLEVIRYLGQAADFIKTTPLKTAVKEADLATLYYYISFCYQLINNVPERMKALENCIAVSRRLNFVDRTILLALYNRGEYFFDLGDYHHCIEYFKECNARSIQHLPAAIDREDSADLVSYSLSSFVWQVNAHIRLREYETAETLLNSQVGQHGMPQLAAYKGTFYGVRAEMELHKGNYEQAISSFRKALSVEKSNFSRKQLLNTMANEVYFRHYQQYDKAMAMFREALALKNTDKAKQKVDAFESLNILSNMGELYARQGNFDQAFVCYRKALDHIQPGITTAEIVSSPPAAFVDKKKTHYLTGLFIEQANTWQRKYGHTRNPDDLYKAIAAYKEADRLVNRIKGEQANLNSKLFWRSNSHGLYEQALQACYASGNMEDAFYFFEKSRAVLLNDQLADQRWMGEQDIQQQTQALKRISTLNRALESPILPPATRNSYEAERAENQQLLDRLTANIKERNPFYYQNFLDSNFVSLQQVKLSMFKDYGALIEVFAGDSAVYVMVVDAGNTRLRRIDKQIYEGLANEFIRYLTNYDLQNNRYEDFASISRQLYQLIFDQLPLPKGRLIISPDGAYFPFEALLTSDRPGAFLLSNHAISYTYSARYLLNDFSANASRKARPFMGFAPVQYAGTQLPELLESDRSLQSLTSYFSGADNYIGKEASRRNFLQHFTDYRIIQLYTHAMDNKELGEPVIYFADSLLYLSDLVSNKRPATSLVVLSACETGAGRFYQGEGVFSFNRGFAALGIPAAITSLWKADNKKTYALTSLFYKFLSAGEPADVALQHAKLEFMKGSKENMLPYYWAVPVLTGKIMEIPPPEGMSLWLIVPAIALGIILLMVGFRWWKGSRAARRLQQPLVE
ncbi:CHAT domain-containing protein [Paraflavitalea sp. CAU 1676]|uniref:CHAT domain-containing protein n=1 Tax=Paraflavitalea sp. CAU 1676 TaxID=3032598 RepID=UPI0023DC3FC7|nr:CHAT domain-containing protein [Paraflavitalea sp. CAU 1676]MDF2188231.1 CHAT domain-containing protein [Paraflavitalea sp. CAU 1676]